jgi:hypothetical protein
MFISPWPTKGKVWRMEFFGSWLFQLTWIQPSRFAAQVASDLALCGRKDFQFEFELTDADEISG